MGEYPYVVGTALVGMVVSVALAISFRGETIVAVVLWVAALIFAFLAGMAFGLGQPEDA